MTPSGRLRDLRLTNFKGFRSLELVLGRVTVLTGTNSSGKSTAMQAIALIEQSRGQDPPGLVLNGPLVELGDFQDVLYDRVERGSSDDDSLGIHLRATSGGWQRFGGSVESVADFVPKDPADHDDPEVPWARLTFIRADRLGPVLFHQKSHSAVVRERSVGTHGEFAVHFLLEHSANEVHRSVRLPGYGSTLDQQAAAWLDRVSNETRIYPANLEGTGATVLRFSNGPVSGLSGGRLHRSTNVGFGLSYCLPIIVACLTARRGDLLLIENPEAHLHPAAQSEIARLCARASNAGAQVILETHSDHIVNAIRIAIGDETLRPADVEMYYFERQLETGVPQPHRLQVERDGSISHWPRGFFDEYLSSLLRLSDFSQP